ncbi:MAG: M23 family metallopeptidase [Gaiellales bacterium]|nr:MAG: M23 family metallopeptidase [Gaiellales bacterium]
MRKPGRVLVIVLIFLFLDLSASPATLALAACADRPPAAEAIFTWPALGQLTAGWTLDCVSDRGHRGIDIASTAVGEIRAAAAGTIAFAGYTPAEGGGLTLAISHDGGLRSTYLHLGELVVKQGQWVEQGEVIATSDGRPLHFGIRLSSANGDYLDPLELLPPADSIEATGLPQEQVSEAVLMPPEVLPAPPPAPVTSPAPAPAATSTTLEPALSEPPAAYAMEPDAGLLPASALATPAARAVLPGNRPAWRSFEPPAAAVPPVPLLPVQAAVGRAPGAMTSSQPKHASPPGGILRLGAGLSLIMAAASGAVLLAGRQSWTRTQAAPAAPMPLLD